MSGATEVMRDERSDVVENASHRLAYIFINYALLVDVMYRSLVRRESSWELLAIIVVGGLLSLVYQGRHRVLTRRSAVTFVLTLLTAGIVAAVVAAIRFLE